MPEAIRQPSFVVSCADSGGRSFFALHSPTTTPEIQVGDRHLRYNPAHGTVFVRLENTQLIEEELFPPARAGRKHPQITIGQRWVVLQGLAFSCADFATKYWREKQFARLTGADIPFTLTRDGCVLVVNLLYGYEEAATPIEIHYELIHAFGNEAMLPSDEADVSDLAFRDFSIAISRDMPRDPGWSFEKFSRSLKGPSERNVLVLGSYKEDQASRFERLETMLRELHWFPIKLKDATDLPIQSNAEKFIAALMYSRFVIVIDDAPSGHIAEVSELLSLRWRPVIMLRESARPSTMYLEDRIRTNDYFRVAQIDELTRDSLLPHIEWAEVKTHSQIEMYNEVNHWRSKS